jgi:dipeptidyl aminopeptidase/acylaminoacyl peptidase
MAIRNFAAGRWALSRRSLLASAGGLGIAVAAGPVAAQQITPHALEDLYAKDGVRGVALSPSGARIAIIREIHQGGTRLSVLDVLDAANPSAPPKRAPLGDVDCESMVWASDERLLVRIALGGRAVTERTSARSLGSITAEAVISRRMVSINPDTGGAVVLFDNEPQRMRTTRNLGSIVDLLHDDPEHVLMMAPTQARRINALYKVNVMTGRAEEFERGDFDTIGWETRDGVPVLRFDINAAGNTLEVMARAPGERQWRFVRRMRIAEVLDFEYVAPTEQGDVILVSARQEGEDVQSIREFNLRTGVYGAPIASRPRSDVSGGLTDDRGTYLGAAYWNDRLEYDFAVPELAPHHRAMNRFFDNTCNVRLIDIDRTHNRFLSYVSGPNEPGAWYLYDRAARSFVNLTPRTALQTERLGRTEALDVMTRDGASIRAYLTAPPGGAPGPLIVLPHGGPELRDVMNWDRTVQALVTEGWWVLQPNFRGSGGYGLAFASEGWGRWGDRMQEDVEDAVDHAIKTRGLDPAKVGIMGTSYGGYAALMGAVRRPDLYKAAISICGDSDLPELLANEKRGDNSPENITYQFWSTRIGDPEEDAAALALASPRQRASEIACPVMLVHGVDDPIVPVFQSRRMKEALERAGKSVDYIEIRGAGHADWEDGVELDLMTQYIELFRRVFA